MLPAVAEARPELLLTRQSLSRLPGLISNSRAGGRMPQVARRSARAPIALGRSPWQDCCFSSFSAPNKARKTGACLSLSSDERALVAQPPAVQTLLRLLRGFRHKALQRPEALLGKLGVQAADPLHVRKESLIALLCEFDLNLDHLVQRPRAREPLNIGTRLFERFPGEVAVGVGDGLNVGGGAGYSGRSQSRCAAHERLRRLSRLID